MEWEGFTVSDDEPTAKEYGLDGYVDYETYELVIGSHLRGVTRLDTLLHEGLHVLAPELPEKEVLRIASALARLAWGNGYRRVHRA